MHISGLRREIGEEINFEKVLFTQKGKKKAAH
ncbi:hypothetical protein P872_15325 [Rhodonellum psychrophilum GCM71 = DSM 17998]|uniref:Uncharacterized protein n=1 Tax=Rhodonellum psychrophilum GCM71 = DSM 17998 TaxID=1123057 RepID=U5C253_9BACT|nr:hypothetical protein P872_15325 [Rhodonellum psychrophilum GCM71 = DSM 17998]